MKHSNFTVLSPVLNTDYLILLRTSAGANGNSRALVSEFLTNFLGMLSTDDIAWSVIDKTGSDLADLATKSHTDLTDIGTRTHAQIDSVLDNLDATKFVNLAPYPSDLEIEIADGTIAFTVPALLNGYNLTDVLASVYEPGIGTGELQVQIRRSRAGTDNNMLTTPVTLSENEYYKNDGVINTSYDDLATGDQLFVDTKAVTGTTPPKGLSVVLTFE